MWQREPTCYEPTNKSEFKVYAGIQYLVTTMDDIVSSRGKPSAVTQVFLMGSGAVLAGRPGEMLAASSN